MRNNVKYLSSIKKQINESGLLLYRNNKAILKKSLIQVAEESLRYVIDDEGVKSNIVINIKSSAVDIYINGFERDYDRLYKLHMANGVKPKRLYKIFKRYFKGIVSVINANILDVDVIASTFRAEDDVLDIDDLLESLNIVYSTSLTSNGCTIDITRIGTKDSYNYIDDGDMIDEIEVQIDLYLNEHGMYRDNEGQLCSKLILNKHNTEDIG